MEPAGLHTRPPGREVCVKAITKVAILTCKCPEGTCVLELVQKYNTDAEAGTKVKILTQKLVQTYKY